MSFTPRGIIAAMVTPLREDYRLDEEATRTLIDFLIEGGIHGLFVAGTSGEFYGLSPEDRKRLLEVSVEQSAGRVPVYGGVDGITTQEAIKNLKIAESCGVEAVSVLTPMFINPTQEELYLHYKAIAEVTDLSILAYNNPPKTGISLASSTVARLSEIENIVGVKDSSGDFTLMSEYIRLTRGKDFSVLAGRDTLIYGGLCYGGAGAITACANLIPRTMADIYDKYVAGDMEGALEAQYACAPVRMAFSLGSYPTILKEGLKILGIDVGPCFPPVGNMSEQAKEKLAAILLP